jgi:hypothetical protein
MLKFRVLILVLLSFRVAWTHPRSILSLLSAKSEPGSNDEILAKENRRPSSFQLISRFFKKNNPPPALSARKNSLLSGLFRSLPPKNEAKIPRTVSMPSWKTFKSNFNPHLLNPLNWRQYRRLSPIQRLATTPMFFVSNARGSPYLQGDTQVCDNPS